MLGSASVVLLFLQAACAAYALSVTEHPAKEDPHGPLKIRRGKIHDRFLTESEQRTLRKSKKDLEERGVRFNNLHEVLSTIRNSLPKGFGHNSTIVNVGASWKDVDPIYELNLSKTHPDGYNLVGYECDSNRVPVIAKHRPDVKIREMCVTGPTIVRDLQKLKVESRFSLIKTDIDSVDGPVLDSVLREFQPYVVYSEIMWDFAPPVEFTLVKIEERNFNPFTGGCFGMSLSMAHHILQRNGYRLIEAAHANIIAVHEDVAHLFEDRPQDPWFWFQFTKSGFYHTHWMGAGMKNPATSTPLSRYGEGLGLYTEVERTDGHDNFGKPPVGIRSMDVTMSRIAKHVQAGCKLSGNHRYMLAVGDRCCAPQWGVSESCVCEFPDKARDNRHKAA